MQYSAPLPAPVPTEPRFLAVIYAFAVWSGGERQLVTEERIAASALAMLQPQLDAAARRTRVDQGPGLIVFDNYRDAFQAAQSLATVATTVEVREVTPATEQRGEGWNGANGARYVTLPDGLVRSVKG
jgi:hypothetical protein